MAGVKELNGGRSETGAGFVISGPFDLAVVFEALEAGGDFVHLVVGVEGVFANPGLVPLLGHDVDGIVQDALDEEIAQFTHQNVGLGKMPQRDGERADVIVMAMRKGDGVNFLVLDQVIQGHGRTAFAFGMRSGIHQQAVSFQIHEPGAGADVGGGV